MANASSTITAVGNENKLFTIPFSYISESHLKFYVNNVDTSSGSSLYTATVQTGGTQVEIKLTADNTTPVAGTIVKLERNTPITTPSVVFSNSSTLKASDLNTNTDQLLFAVQEAADDSANSIVVDGTSNWDALSKRIKNTADPVDAQDAATKAHVETVLASNAANVTAAQTAQTAAETAKTAAETAKTAAESSATDATNNGAAQVALATTQANNAAASATAAANSAASVDIATQAEAEAGTSTKLMSALRTKQAVDSYGLLAANNLSDVTAATARTNLGLGTAATQASTAFQAADADIAKTDVVQTFTVSQRGSVTSDADLSFDLGTTNNFSCTPTGTGTLTFTNITAGQSGNILLINSGGHAISLHANTKGDANLASTISTAGTYWLSYFCGDGTNVQVVTSSVFA